MDMTKKLTKDLIEMYWERKCLWQVNSKEYKKRDMKKKAYQEIVMYLRRNGVKEANAKLVREKIQNLRRAMRKEKKRIDSSGGTHSPTLWYYDLLIFVNDQYEDTLSLSKLGEEDSEIICTDTDEDLYIDDDEKKNNKTLKAPTPKALESKEPKEDETKEEKITVKLEEITAEPLINTTEFEAVGINFTAKLQRMESKQQIFAELLIQKVLARGLLGQLNEKTDVIDRLK